MSAGADVEVRPIDLSPPGIERSYELLRAVFPEARYLSPAYLERLYRGNPVGETLGFAAWAGDALVGHYLMIPVRSIVQGEEELGIWPFQLAVHPGYRGRSLFRVLVERSFERMADLGYTYIVGITNAQSTPIYVERFGCQLVRPLEVRLGLGTTPRPGAAEGFEYARVWTREGVSWRLGLPEHPYALVRRGDLGHLYAPTGRHGVAVEVAALPLEWLPGDLPGHRSAQPLRLWIGADPTRNWSRSAYVPLPRRLWPSPLNLVFGDLSGRKRRLDPRRVRFSGFDFDAY